MDAPRVPAKPADRDAWKEGKRRLNVHLDAGLADRLNAAAYSRRVRPRSVVEEALRQYLDRLALTA